MAVSLKEFRDRFPNASMLSDLLGVENGQFMVRVTIQTQDSGTSTGLSANASLELAEDHARQRALYALGLGDLKLPSASSPISPSNLPMERIANSVPQGDRTEVPDLETAPSVLEEPEAPVLESPAMTSTMPISSPPPQTVAQMNGVETEKPHSVPKSDSTPQAPLLQPEPPASAPEVHQSFDAHSTNNPPFPSEVPADVPPEPIPASALPAPINLSDVIAQTDIELRRLGWSVEVGREYLGKTYNKRSRHELSEEELIQFLCHLEGLPAPQATIYTDSNK